MGDVDRATRVRRFGVALDLCASSVDGCTPRWAITLGQQQVQYGHPGVHGPCPMRSAPVPPPLFAVAQLGRDLLPNVGFVSFFLRVLSRLDTNCPARCGPLLRSIQDQPIVLHFVFFVKEPTAVLVLQPQFCRYAGYRLQTEPTGGSLTARMAAAGLPALGPSIQRPCQSQLTRTIGQGQRHFQQAAHFRDR